MQEKLPSIRWGIVATGLISSWFVEDIVMSRPDAKVNHIVTAIGSSSLDKGRAFAKEHCPTHSPAIYGSYQEVYDDPNVDLVYIGTPHGFHKQNCLDAIAAGKNVFCEKAFTLNARDAKEVFAAAKQKNVYVAEAMWLRHRPLVHDLRRMLHKEKVIGEVFRAFSDFGNDKDVPNLPETSRYRQSALGAGSLLDLGIYSLTWIIMALEPESPERTERPMILASQTHWEDIELMTSAIIRYPSGRQGIVSSTTLTNGNPDMLARIHGLNGSVEVHGSCPSAPVAFTIYPKFTGESGEDAVRGPGTTYKYPVPGRGYQFEADSAALDVLAGRKESWVMPWSETVRVLEMMDEMRRQGGTRYEADGDD
ncbi:unnamed protein product [Clonostachys chloroleuca]|uniref:D-xylose 1-dehydrogenase (NADP(+), D-xylono-1,5-lactone-forming) n=1 Tax=Clonostachys chloroleuca TaxID=1926264 RepID=A0AA35Q556_9HYPO|nr:unnamed protein product [Clonostachys chloroleuca]